MTRAQAHLERPVSYVAAAKKLAAIRGDAGREGGWIYNANGQPIAHGWRTYADLLHAAGLVVQDSEHNAGNGKWYVWVLGLSAAECVAAERIFGAVAEAA